MAEVAVSNFDSASEQTAAFAVIYADGSADVVNSNMLYADRAKQPPANIDCNTQEVTISSYKGSKSSDGLFEGVGYAEFVSGNTYEGTFERGQMHGQGKYVWTDGLVYHGTFVQNKLTGNGVYEWPSGASYEGGVLNGKRHGFGTMRFAGSDTVYTGEWLDSQRQGQGKLVFDKAQKCFYEGGWKNNLKHGQGTMHYSSGNTYTGQWDTDKKQGQGCMQWGQGEQYTGQWWQGLQNGIGCHVWPQPASLANGTPNHAFFLMHNRYQGMFKDGQRHGYGALHYATGSSYEGEWQHEQKHGRGVFCFEDGTVFDGTFAEDQAVIKEGQAWGPVGSGVKLRLDDLLGDTSNKQAILTGLSNELLCVNTELRTTYDAYSSRQRQKPWGWGQPQHSAALTSAQLWDLLRECNVPEPDCSLVHINLALAQACKSVPEAHQLRSDLATPEVTSAIRGGESALHTPLRQVLFRDFSEALVRIAQLKFQHLPSLQQRLHQLLHSLILPHAVKGGQSKLWMYQQPEADQQAMSATATALQPLFLEIAALEPDHVATDGQTATAADKQSSSSQMNSSTHASVSTDTTAEQPCSSSEQDQFLWARCTASLRRVLQTLQSKGLLGAGASMQQALAVFQSACYAPHEPQQLGSSTAADSLGDILNLDSRVTFPEFVEGLARWCAQEARSNEHDSWSANWQTLLSLLENQGRAGQR